MNKLLRALVFFMLCGLVIIAAVRCDAEKKLDSPLPASVPISLNVDLSGDWTTKEDAKVKFVAEIQASTILIYMVMKSDTVAYYYGTFETPTTKKTTISKAIKDGKLVWSTAEAKDFLYQDGSLIFNYEALGIRSAIELVREK